MVNPDVGSPVPIAPRPSFTEAPDSKKPGCFPMLRHGMSQRSALLNQT
jgi:hypothetical protein